MYFAVTYKSTCKVGVHDADTSLVYKSLLIPFGQALTETCCVMSCAATEPVINIGSHGIVIWHRRIDPVKIYLSEYEITHVLYGPTTEIAPEIWGGGIVPFECIPGVKHHTCTVEPFQVREACRTPVDVVSIS